MTYHILRILSTGLETIPGIHFCVVNRSPDGHKSKAAFDMFNAASVAAFGPSFATRNMALQWPKVIDPLPDVTLSQIEKTPSAG